MFASLRCGGISLMIDLCCSLQITEVKAGLFIQEGLLLFYHLREQFPWLKQWLSMLIKLYCLAPYKCTL
uniref:Protein S-acyltransferase 24 n=1 Tax=Rhizophora mucronata TaxID=61149 RepID=A0A2P2M1J2_RHIMU